jgi:hypothetical protein
VKKKSQNSRNQGFSYYFCLMIEGCGSGSVPLTNGSGSRRPKHIVWIRRIRIRNTGGYRTHAYLSGGGELGRALTPRLLSSELLGGGLAAEAVPAAAVGQARPAPHPAVQPRPAAARPTLLSIRLQPEPAGKHTLCTSVADPGCLSRIPDPDFTHPGSRIPDLGSKNSNKREG